MAAGDWVAGSYITIVGGLLPALSAGEAGAAQVNYYVVLPSGGRVYNGGATNLAPFTFSGDDTKSIASQASLLVVSLAQYENLPVHLTNVIVFPDGSTDPTSWQIPTRYLIVSA